MIRIHIEIVITNCTTILSPSFLEDYWHSECKNEDADQDYIGPDAGRYDSILRCVCLCDRLMVVPATS